jgi:hypothetical protein
LKKQYSFLKYIPSNNIQDCKIDIFALTTRTKNVCLSNGIFTVKDILLYYKENASFLKFRNCGSKTNFELVDLCESLMTIDNIEEFKRKNSHKLINYRPDNEQKIFEQIEYILKSNYLKNKSLIDFIEAKIYQQSGRVKNALGKIMVDENNNIERFFNEIISLLSLNKRNKKTNIGKSSLLKIEKFIADIKVYLKDLQSLEKDKDSFSILKEILTNSLDINETFIDKYEVPYNNKRFHFFDFIENIIIHYILNKRELIVFTNSNYYYKNIKKLTLKDISTDLNITRERVRQITEEIKMKLVKQLYIFSFFFHEILEHTNYQFEINNEIIILNDKIVDDINNEEGLNLTLNCYSFLMSIFVNRTYLLFLNDKAKLKNQYLIKKELWEQFDFIGFYNDLKNRCLRIEKDYSISLDDYLLNFSISKNINLNNKLKDLVKEIIITEFNCNIDINYIIHFIRTTKKRLAEYLFEILDKYGKPMKLHEIEKQLYYFNPHLKYSFNSLRSTLIMGNEFVSYGSTSTYGLRKWNDFHGPSARDMVENILKKSKRPLHISEIKNKIKLIGNRYNEFIRLSLKSDKLDRFVFYDWGFIGLKNKKCKDTDIDFKKILDNLQGK